ncbi:hypothetical protein Y032_0053g2336 [Ancylostoma ceylanicum]|nr:hypothetical protein Y032_0053g2336 [Ancylostoma ceylanicum]
MFFLQMLLYLCTKDVNGLMRGTDVYVFTEKKDEFSETHASEASIRKSLEVRRQPDGHTSHSYNKSKFVVQILSTCHADGYTAPFKCNGSQIGDMLRLRVLNNYNINRELIIKGRRLDNVGTALPKPENMYKMIYDCNLEEKAKKVVENCPSIPQKTAANGLNFR